MNKPISNFSFRIMAWMLRNRDNRNFTDAFLSEIPLARGAHILDYGCGTGSFSIAAAHVAGASGHVYCADIHPLAIRIVRKKMNRLHLTNITPILTDCSTGLPQSTINTVLLYDVLHLLSDISLVVKEVVRVLKSGGTLSVSDHHMQEYDIKKILSHFPLITLKKIGTKTLSYVKC